MHGLVQINLLDILEQYGEDSCKDILSSFSCPLNADVDDFIHNKAIDFAKQRIAISFLVFTVKEEGNILVGYYTLTNKFVSVSAGKLSNTLQKRIAKFSQYDAALDRYLVSMPLIAQLGRNYSQTAIRENLDGDALLSLALHNISNAQRIIGGKTTYIECASNPKLYNFYSHNNFVQFGERKKEAGELAESPVLVQMLKYSAQRERTF